MNFAAYLNNYDFMNSVLPGRPFSLSNCSLSNQTSDTFNIDCIEGFDGGLPQVFVLEVVEVPALRLVRNLTLMVSGFFTEIF